MNSTRDAVLFRAIRQRTSLIKLSRLATLFIGAVLLFAPPMQSVQAQPNAQRFGLGGTVGSTPGVTFKLYLEPDSARTTVAENYAIDVSISWLDNAVYLWSVHALTNRSLADSPLKLFLGPGAVFGSDHARLFFGLSSSLGVYFEKHRFEVFMQITPRILFAPDLKGEFGSAVGLRYYL